MSEVMSDARSAGIQVIARAARLLRALSESPSGLTQAELGEQLGMASTTVHRILSALQAEGMVSVTGRRGRYRIGGEISRMAASVQHDMLSRLHPYLAQLSRTVGETVDLMVLEDARMLVLDQVVGPHRLRAVSTVGEWIPAYACASGKAALAALTPDRLAATVPAQLEALTPATLTTRAALLEQLRTVRVVGVAIDREENAMGICGVAAVLDPRQPAPLALGVTLPALRLAGREDELVAAVLAVLTVMRNDLDIGD